jgi:hypothetical protein
MFVAQIEPRFTPLLQYVLLYVQEDANIQLANNILR